MSARQERRSASQVDERGNLIHQAQNPGVPGSTGAAGTTDPLGAPGSTGAYNTTNQPAIGGQQQQQHRPTGGTGELGGQYPTGGGDRHDSTEFMGGNTGGVGGGHDTTGLTGALGGHDTGIGGGHQTAGGGKTHILKSGSGTGGGPHTTRGTGGREGYPTTGNEGRTDLTGGTGGGEYGGRDHTTGYGTTGTGAGGGGCGTGTLGTEGMPAGAGGVKSERKTETTIPVSTATTTGLGSDMGRGEDHEGEHREGEKKGMMEKIKDHIPGAGCGGTRET